MVDRPRRRCAPALLVGVLVGLGLVLALALPSGPAGAHATLQETTPAPDALVDAVPAAVELRFDEPVSASTGAVRVIAPDGTRVDRTITEADGGRTLRVTVDGEQRGTYTVAHRVVSDDGHTITGSFVFHVATRTGAADVDQSVPLATAAAGGAGRWLSYAGAVLAVGAALLLLLVRATGGPGPARPRLAALVAGGAAAGAVGGGLAVLAQTATTTGRSLPGALGLVGEVAGDSRPVAAALLRSAVVAVGAVIGVAGRRRVPALVAAGAVVAAGGLLAPVAGHPWTAEPRSLAVPADGLHLLAVCVWLGLVTALAAAGPRLPDPVAAVRKVSGAALVASAVVAVSGTASAWTLLGSVDALFRTASGQLVILKVIGFGALVGLGWINRSRLVPLLLAATAPGRGAPSPPDGGAGDGRAPAAETPSGAVVLRRLLQVVRVEVAIGALVLVATAGLVNQPPGRDQVDRPFSGTRTVDAATMLLEVEPARAGQNEMHLYLTGADGAPAPFDAVEVKAGRPGVPERKLAVEQISPDHAVVYGASLPTPGRWTIIVTTVRVGQPRQFRYEVPVR